MNRLITIACAVLVAACAMPTSTVDAGPKRTQVRTVTDWSGNDEGQRVIEVTTPQGSVTCIETKDKYGGGLSDDPKGVSVGISCDWAPK